MKVFFRFIILIIAIIFFTGILFYVKDILFAPGYNTGSVCFKNNCFLVELAKTNAEIERGLMFRTHLDQNKGMIFIFNKEGIYPFWMKNTLIPLDLIWINKENKIVFISRSSQPCSADIKNVCPSINPQAGALYVLEINGGVSRNIGLKIGDKLDISLKQ
jgi:hypothetical protein